MRRIALIGAALAILGLLDQHLRPVEAAFKPLDCRGKDYPIQNEAMDKSIDSFYNYPDDFQFKVGCQYNGGKSISDNYGHYLEYKFYRKYLHAVNETEADSADGPVYHNGEYDEIMVTIQTRTNGWVGVGFDPISRRAPKMKNIKALIITPPGNDGKSGWFRYDFAENQGVMNWRMGEDQQQGDTPDKLSEVDALNGCDDAPVGEGCIHRIRQGYARTKTNAVYSFTQFHYRPSADQDDQLKTFGGGIFVTHAFSRNFEFTPSSAHYRKWNDRWLAPDLGVTKKEDFYVEEGDPWDFEDAFSRQYRCLDTAIVPGLDISYADAGVDEASLKELLDVTGDWDDAQVDEFVKTKLLYKLSQIDCKLNGFYYHMSDIKDTIGDIGRQMIMSTVAHETRARNSGYSGLVISRLMAGGTKSYLEGHYVGSGLCSMHNHGNHRDTMGIGQFVGMINGVTFVTRHNDYQVMRRSSEEEAKAWYFNPYHCEAHGDCPEGGEEWDSEDPRWQDWWDNGGGHGRWLRDNKMVPVDYPSVPEEVLRFPDDHEDPEKAGTERNFYEQVAEMQEWFRAFKAQTHSVPSREGEPVRDYRPYFLPVICVLEGAWVNQDRKLDKDKKRKKEAIKEIFPSDRHQIDARNWDELTSKARFMMASGKKDSAENIPYLPTALRNIKEGSSWKPTFSNFVYTVTCENIPFDVPKNWLKMNVDKSSLLRNMPKMVNVYSAQQLEDRLFRGKGTLWELTNFPHNPDVDAKLKYNIIDKVMEQVPGRDGPGGSYIDDVFKRTCYHFERTDEALNVGYFSRYFSVKSVDAMGVSDAKRGFFDMNMWAATAPNSPSITETRTYDSVSKSFYRQKWTWAFPMELIYLTPLKHWNPRNIENFGLQKAGKNNKVTADGASGSESKPYHGISHKYWYGSPVEFYGDFDVENVDKADTDVAAVWVYSKNTDDDGNKLKHEMVASGTSIVTKEIGNGVKSMRMRYPIMPIHEHGTLAYKELRAVEKMTEYELDKIKADISNLDELIKSGHINPNAFTLTSATTGSSVSVNTAGVEQVVQTEADKIPKITDTYSYMEIKLNEASSGHEHKISLNPADIKKMKVYGKIHWASSDYANAHNHYVGLRWDQHEQKYKMMYCAKAAEDCFDVKQKLMSVDDEDNPDWLQDSLFGREDINGVFWIDPNGSDVEKGQREDDAFPVEIRQGRLILNLRDYVWSVKCDAHCGGHKDRVQDQDWRGDDLNNCTPKIREDWERISWKIGLERCEPIEMRYADYHGKEIEDEQLEILAKDFTTQETNYLWMAYDAITQKKVGDGDFYKLGTFVNVNYFGGQDAVEIDIVEDRPESEGLQKWIDLEPYVKNHVRHGSLVKQISVEKKSHNDFGIYVEYTDKIVVLTKPEDVITDVTSLKNRPSGVITIDPNKGAVADAFRVTYGNGVIYIKPEFESYSWKCSDCGGGKKSERCIPDDITVPSYKHHMEEERLCWATKVRYLDADNNIIPDSQLAALAPHIDTSDNQFIAQCYDCEEWNPADPIYSFDVLYYGELPANLNAGPRDGYNFNLHQGETTPSGRWADLDQTQERDPDTSQGWKNAFGGDHLIFRGMDMSRLRAIGENAGVFIKFNGNSDGDYAGRYGLKLRDSTADQNMQDYQNFVASITFEGFGDDEAYDESCPSICWDGHNALEWTLAFGANSDISEFNSALFGTGGVDTLTFSDVVLITLIEVILIVGCCFCGALIAHKVYAPPVILETHMETHRDQTNRSSYGNHDDNLKGR